MVSDVLECFCRDGATSLSEIKRTLRNLRTV